MESNDYLVAEYLLKHGDVIKNDILEEVTCALTHTIHKKVLVDLIIGTIVHRLSNSLNLTYQEVAEIVNEEYLSKLLGRGFLG